jgi:hypothetical protein
MQRKSLHLERRSQIEHAALDTGIHTNDTSYMVNGNSSSNTAFIGLNDARPRIVPCVSANVAAVLKIPH